MSFENILVSGDGHVQYITINRPTKLNALNKATIKELSDAFRLAESDKNIRVVILTGSGDKAFVAGADISEFAHFSDRDGEKLSAEGHDLLFNYIPSMGTPVIAAINGFALGGGLELAMSCHIRVASDAAKMGLPEVSLGVIPGYGGTQRLTQLVGIGRALEMITTASMVTASEAHRMGLVNHIVEHDALMTKCNELAKKIAFNSPTAIAASIRAVNGMHNERVDGFALEVEAFGSCFGTPDFIEGTSAFLEKRKPNFTGNKQD